KPSDDQLPTSINGNIIANPGFVREFATEVNDDGEPVLASPILSAWGSIMSVGQIIGMTTLPFLSDRFGRKAAMYAYWFVLAMSILTESLARTWPAWLVAKLLAGIGVGFWFSLGRFFAPVALQVHSNVDRDNWLTPVYTQWSQIGLMLIIYLLVPETPAWCVTHGFEERAKKSLRKLHWEIKNYDVEHQYQVLVMAVNHEYEGTDGRRTVTALWTLLTQQFIGLTLFSTFASYFFQQAGIQDPFQATCINSGINIAANLTMILTVDRFDRRNYSCGGSTLSWACAAIGILGVVPRVGATSTLLVFFACLWNIGMTANGATGWGFIDEISSQRLRPYTAGFGAASTCVAGVVMNILTPYMVNANEWGWELRIGWFYAGIGLPFVVGMWFIIPETKGRSAAELDELFESKVKHWRFHKTQTATQAAVSARQV
ncbi:hypothetical protein S40285_08868, partial [Stachybotrys chlorohalonatus IBT 40285]